ncbi:MAG: COG1361 S-layer family protein [Candidatus Spyradocola sp.]
MSIYSYPSSALETGASMEQPISGAGDYTFTFPVRDDVHNDTYSIKFVASYKLDGATVTSEPAGDSFNIGFGQDWEYYDPTQNSSDDKKNLQSIYDITLRATPIAKDDKNHKVDLQLHLAYKGDKNFSNAPLSYFRIEPVVSGKTEEFPFELEYASYGKTMADIQVETNANGDVTDTWFDFPFKVKSDAVNGYYPISFKLYHLYQNTNLQETDPVETTITTYVEIRNGKKPSSGDSTVAPTDPSTAILLLEGYTVEPSEIKAGDEFDLTLRIRNTSDKTVTDVKSTLSELNKCVLPVSGASSFFIEKVAPGEVVEQTVRLKATASAGVDPVELTLSNAFVQDNTAKTSSDTFVLPVTQVSNLSLDPPSYPIETYAGESFNLMMNLYNKGKSRIYNVSVYLDSDSMAADENYYAGNMESGSSKSYDVMVTPNADASGQITGDIVVTYEDAEGNVTEKRTPINLNVASYEDMYGYYEEPDMMEGDMMVDAEPASQGIPFWVWILVAAGVAGAAAVIVVVIVRKRKKAQVDDDEMD